MFWASEKTLKEMEQDFRQGLQVPIVAKKHYENLRRKEGKKKEPPLDSFKNDNGSFNSGDFDHCPVYKRVERFKKILEENGLI